MDFFIYIYIHIYINICTYIYINTKEVEIRQRQTPVHGKIIFQYFNLAVFYVVLESFLFSPENSPVQFLAQVNNKLICIAKDVNCSEPSVPVLLLLSNCNLLLC